MIPKIKEVPSSKLKDYAGMNHYAAKDMHWKPCPPKNEIWVDRNMSEYKKEQTAKHELLESHYMGDHNMEYGPAHKLSLKQENKPMSKVMRLIGER